MKTKYFIRKANDLGYIIQMKDVGYLLVAKPSYNRVFASIDFHDGSLWINSDDILIIEHCVKYAKSVAKGEHK